MTDSDSYAGTPVLRADTREPLRHFIQTREARPNTDPRVVALHSALANQRASNKRAFLAEQRVASSLESFRAPRRGLSPLTRSFLKQSATAQAEVDLRVRLALNRAEPLAIQMGAANVVALPRISRTELIAAQSGGGSDAPKRVHKVFDAALVSVQQQYLASSTIMRGRALAGADLPTPTPTLQLPPGGSGNTERFTIAMAQLERAAVENANLRDQIDALTSRLASRS
jgi:hypothetical protein